MRNIIVMSAAVVSLACSAAAPAMALPTIAPGGAAQTTVQSDIQDSRLYCYNRYTGRFLHWGRCGGGYYRPRVYCRNSYTGRFLHWGSCW